MSASTSARRWRFETEPLSSDSLRAFSDLVRDPNPIHVDPEVARGLGLPGAIAQGGLVVSAISMMLEAERVRELDVRLLAPAPEGTTLICEGTATAIEDDGTTTIECVVRSGDSTVFARAVARVDGTPA